MTSYKLSALKELTDQQVRFAPPGRRLDHMARGERLIAEIDPYKDYPYQYVVFRLTEYRPDAYPELLIRGQDLIHDLGTMIAELARSMPPVPVESVAEKVLTLEEISKKLNVTTKTINRWRKRGLIGLPVLVNGKRHVGFLPSLVDPFLTTNNRLLGFCAVKTSTSLRVVSVEDLGHEQEMVDITTATGDFIANGVISHNCFARPTPRGDWTCSATAACCNKSFPKSPRPLRANNRLIFIPKAPSIITSV